MEQWNKSEKLLNNQGGWRSRKNFLFRKDGDVVLCIFV